VKEIQAAAAILSLKEYEGISLNFPDLNIQETLGNVDVILSSEATTPSNILSSSRLLQSTIAERRRILDEKLKKLKARDAKESWEKKLAEFVVWAKKTCECKEGTISWRFCAVTYALNFSFLSFKLISPRLSFHFNDQASWIPPNSGHL
jgi:hypothetical protein